VLEYVEGETLHGPMSFDEALPIIRQLIDGIEAAHDKNIIHRDLKTANIKITPEGDDRQRLARRARRCTPRARVRVGGASRLAEFLRRAASPHSVPQRISVPLRALRQ
jgi:serine/threonine protein kinase